MDRTPDPQLYMAADCATHTPGANCFMANGLYEDVDDNSTDLGDHTGSTVD